MHSGQSAYMRNPERVRAFRNATTPISIELGKYLSITPQFNLIKFPLYFIEDQLWQARRNGPIPAISDGMSKGKDTGHRPVLPGVLDPYTSKFNGVDHLLARLAQDVLDNAFAYLPTEKCRELAGTTCKLSAHEPTRFTVDSLRQCSLVQKNKIFNKA